MAVKTITIDMEAYDQLKRLKRPGQSFSQVIKEHLRARGVTGAELLTALASIEPLADATLDELDSVVASRQQELPRVPEL